MRPIGAELAGRRLCTGYFLSRFPQVERAGLDLSPNMLDVARDANHNVPFFEGDFRDAKEEWTNRWDLVTCTWYAYTYADSVEEIEGVLRNLASWNTPNGICFIPVCDPDVLCKTKIPDEPPPDSQDGWLQITGITWTWIDKPSGKQHLNLVAPTVHHMGRMLRKYYQDVRLITYPHFEADCLESRSAFIATGKITV